MRVRNIVTWMMVETDNDLSPNWINIPYVSPNSPPPSQPVQASVFAPAGAGNINADFLLDPRLAWIQDGYYYHLPEWDQDVYPSEYGKSEDFRAFVENHFPGLLDERFVLNLDFVYDSKPYPHRVYRRLDR